MYRTVTDTVEVRTYLDRQPVVAFDIETAPLEPYRMTERAALDAHKARILTTKATKQIAARYGGLENLGTKLMKSENFEMALEEIVWLITILANQSILIHNLQNPGEKRELLTEDAVELLTTPLDLAEYKNAITEAMFKGTKRNIESEDNPSGGNDGKNTQAG